MISAMDNEYLPEPMVAVSWFERIKDTFSFPVRASSICSWCESFTENSQESKRTDKIADANCTANTCSETERIEPAPSSSHIVSLSLNLQTTFEGMRRHLSSMETAVSLEHSMFRFSVPLSRDLRRAEKSPTKLLSTVSLGVLYAAES